MIKNGGHLNRLTVFRDALLRKKSMRRASFSFFICALFFLSVGTSIAQVPGSLVPGRQQEKKTPSVPLLNPAPIAPGVGRQAAPENSQSISFVLNKIILEGNEAISTKELVSFWEEMLGKKVSLQSLYVIANAITELYVDKGYALSFAFIPEQQINNGVVRIRVVEGFVDEVSLAIPESVERDLKKYFGRSVYARVQKQAEKILDSKPLRTADLEKYVLLMNQRPGVSAQVTFVPSETVPSASRLVLNVGYKPVAATLSTDNRLADSLGNWMTSASATMNAGFTGADQFSISRACGINCGVYGATSISWQNYVGNNGLQLGLLWSMSSEKPVKGLLAPLEFSGGHADWTFSASYPVIKSRQEGLDIGGAFKISDNKTKTFSGTLTEDSVRTLELFGAYNLLDKSGAVNYAKLSFTNGLPIFQATKKNSDYKSRVNGSSKFSHVALSVIRNQAILPSVPIMQGVSLYAAGQAQYAVSNPLLSVSQCFYGGADMGRAYDSGSLSGDHCLSGSVELRRDWSRADVGAQAYSFVDAGYVRRKGALAAGEKRATGAQSYGAGFRLSKSNWLQGDAQVAIPFRESVASNGKGTPQLFLKLSLQY